MPDMQKEVNMNGSYSTKAVLAELKKRGLPHTYMTLFTYEKQGIIPEPRRTEGSNTRFYTKEDMEKLIQTIQKHKDEQEKPTKKALKGKADKLFSELIRRKGYCELKGLDNITCAGSLQTMHIKSRGNLNLRYDEKNALCGCSGHHIFYTNNPFQFFELIRTKFPERYEYLNERKGKLATNFDYEEIIEKLSK